MPAGMMSRLFTFKSRLARASFWWGCIAAWAAFAVLFVFLAGALGRAATWVLYPPMLWALLALCVNRLHDRGQRGANLLWALVPVLGPLWLIIDLAFRGGTVGDNQYGPDPRSINVDYLTVRTPSP